MSAPSEADPEHLVWFVVYFRSELICVSTVHTARRR